MTDELVFRDAKTDETCRKAYKQLASIHETCALLVGAVEETSAIMREMRELEDQVSSPSNP